VNVQVVQDKPVSCYDENDGKLRAIATGGVIANRNYKWYKIINGSEIILEEGVNIDTLTDVGKGMYRVEMTDANDSTAVSEYIEVIQPEQLTAKYSITLPSSYNSSDGKIEIAPNGGTTPYFYKWDYGNSSSNPLENIPANDNPYTVTISDSRGCESVLSPRMIYPLEITIAVTDSINCYLGSDGKLQATATGGVGTNYLYKWHKIELGNDRLLGVEENILPEVDAGRYYAEAIDIEGNKTASAYLDFNHPSQLKIDYEVILTSSADAADGTIEATVSGGTPEYSYLWNYLNSTFDKLTELPSGETFYKLTVTDRRGCRDSIRTRLVYPLKVNISIEDSISCYGNTDGRLKANASGGLNSDYEYQWYRLEKGAETIIDGATGRELPNAGAGIYRIRVTGLEENTAFADLKFDSPDLLTVTPSINLPSAYDASDGNIKLTVNGGTPEYFYAWNYNNAADDRLTDIPANDIPYTVAIKDTRNCSATISPRIIYPLEVKIVVGDSISCYGRNDGQLRAIATGVGKNYSYQWYKIENGTDIPLTGTNAATLTNAGKNTYRVKVTDIENNSVLSRQLIFNQPDVLTVNSSITLPSAYDASDGSVRLSVKGGTPGYFYAWNYNSATSDRLTGIPANDTPYTVTVNDARNCAVTISPRIIYPVEVKIVVDDSISCYGRSDGQLRAIATGGVSKNYSYQWYKIENETDKILVNESAMTLSGIAEGIYRVRIKDMENNASSATLIFGQPEPLSVNVEYLRNMSGCKFAADGAVRLSIKGGTTPYACLWQDGTTTPYNYSLPEGMHTFEITDRRGCIYGNTVTIGSPDELLLNISHNPPKAYNSDDASVWVEASGGTSPYKYVWKDRNETTALIDGITHGTYTVTVSDANGCTKTIMDEIPNPPLLEVFIAETQSVSCNGRSDGSLTTDSRGGVGNHRYVWYKIEDNNLRQLVSQKDADNLPAGIYRAQVVDDNNIIAYSDDFKLVEPDVLTVYTTTNGVACNGDVSGWVETKVTGGTAPYNYLWTSGHNTSRVENLVDDRYMVFVTDAMACETKGIAEIRLSPNMIVETTVVQPVCVNDGAINLSVKGGIAPYTYMWNDGSIDKSRSQLPAGAYGVTVTGINGCSRYAQIILETPEPQHISLGDDITLCKGQQLELNVAESDNGTQYKWYRNGKPFASTPAVSISEQGFYEVETVTSMGCRSEGSINIYVVENEIAADFTVATKAIRNEIVKLVNISYPSPERVEWIIPYDPRIAVVDETDEYIEIIFDETDSYTIGISSTVGACQKTAYKEVNILNKGDIPEYEPEEEAFLKSFIAYPNPNSGQFTVKIELGVTTDIRLRLVSIAGSIVDEREAKGSNIYEIYYDIANLQPGIYILQLTSAKANTSLRLVITGN
jgi:hypothetical protein